MRLPFAVIRFTIAVAALAGCGSGAAPAAGTDAALAANDAAVAANDDADQRGDAGLGMTPLTMSITPAGTVVYSPNVFLLDAPTTDLARVEPGRLVFPIESAGGMAERHTGDILVSSRHGNAMFLRRILAVETVGATVVVTTEDASVTDAVKEANLDFNIPVAMEQLKLLPGSPPIPLDAPSGGLFGGKIDFALSSSWDCGLLNCQVSAGMRITPRILGGYFTPKVRIEVQVHILDNHPDLLRFVAYSTLDADLKLGLKIENKGSFRLEGKLFETPEVLIPIGEIPTFVQGSIVVGSEGEFYAPVVDLVLEGGFQAALTSGFEMRKDLTATPIFEGGAFTPTFSAAVVGVGAEVKARRYLAAKVSWMVGIPAGVLEAGPQLTIRKYWQTRWYADSQSGAFQEDSSGHDVTISGEIKTFGAMNALSLKLADWTDSSETTKFTGPFAFFPCARAKDGAYCGDEAIDGFRLGVPGHLYRCAGSDVASDQVCPNGCGPATGVDQAQGKRVACNPAPNNPCHAAADGNYCGNETINGFEGGKLGLPASAQITCAAGIVSRQLSCSGGCGPVPGTRVGCLTPQTGPSAPCGAGDQAGPHNGTCGPDGRVYYCYQSVWRVKDDCVAKDQTCQVQPPGMADICVANSGPAMTGPSAPCGAGDQAGPHNGTCGPDGRVYYCYHGVWHVKDDCVAKSESCVVEPAGTADICKTSSRRLTPPSAPCGAGDQAGPHNGTCGPDGRNYYCYQGVWNLKDDCVARGVACVVEGPGVADHCTSGCTADTDCGAGETCQDGRCQCPGPVCGTSCCGAGQWCGSGSRCCSGCGIGCPC
jgi:hypothetical protein